jgi:CheY-like chemotaxis protein
MQNPNTVLLVDDDQVNAVAVEKVFHELGLHIPLVHLHDGEEALEYLREQSKVIPDIILLDLHMPKTNGIEFLKIVKSDPVLRRIPVIMLTTSQDQQYIKECFALNAAGYMIKSLDDKRLTETIRTIVLYWSSSKLPNQQGDGWRYVALSAFSSGQ